MTSRLAVVGSMTLRGRPSRSDTCATGAESDVYECLLIYTVRLHVMQRTVLLSQFCLSVRQIRVL